MTDDVRRSIASRPESALRCALCHADLGEAAAARCAGCGTLLHAECRDGLAGCPTLGCVASARLAVATTAKADALTPVPRLPLRAWALSAALLPAWAGLGTALRGGGDAWGLSVIAALLFLVPPALLVQGLIQLVVRAVSSRWPVSARAARAFTTVPLLLFLVVATVWSAYEARFQLAPEQVSEVALAPDGRSARVVRREAPKFELGDEPYRVSWLLRVTDVTGRVHEDEVEGRDADSLDHWRTVRYEVAWRATGDALDVVHESGTRSVAYVLPEGVRVVRSDIVHIDDRAVFPLDDDVRERLGRLPVPTDAWQNLSMVRLDQRAEGASFVCERADVVVVLGHEFRDGQVMARGPILVTEGYTEDEVASGAWVFFDGSKPWSLRRVIADRVFVTREPFERADDGSSPPPELVPARRR
jgi:hypothetical protein